MKHPGSIPFFKSPKLPSFILLSLFIFLGILAGCGGEPLAPKKIVTLDEQKAAQKAKEVRESISPKLIEGMDLTLWASEKLLDDAIALDINQKGEAYVTVTNRSTSSEFDIRGHRDWMINSIHWDEVADRKAFLHKELAPENSEKTAEFLGDYNNDGSHDWRDLTVEKEAIYKIEDTSGDGIADRSQLYIKDFHTEVTDVLGGVYSYKGNVYATVAPDVWKLKDNDGDGIADEKESLNNGYQVHIGFSGHGMSGIIMGPDGRLYWGIGDIGLNVVTPDGDTLYYPNQGAILRSNPDGSNLEVFAAGVRNTHEFTFDKYGNLISVDNDGDHPGEFERVVYLINGSDSGWRSSWQYGKYVDPKNNDYKVWMDEDYYKPRFPTQAAHLLPPIAPYHAGPAGMAYNPGTALSPKWKDHFFIAEFVGAPGGSAIHAFTLEPKGASFKLATDQTIVSGVLPTGMDFGPDGALYFNDWIEGWGTKDKGRIWKLDTPETTVSKIRQQTQELLAANFDERSDQELAKLLGHADMRVRQKAQFELAERGATDVLLNVIKQSDEQLARIHGIWGIGQLAREEVSLAKQLVPFLDDQDPKIQAQVAKILGSVRYEQAAEELISLLKSESPRVRLFAAQSLGRLKYHPAIEPIVAMLEANNDEDVYLRNAGAIALARIGDGEALTALHDHPSEAVRIAAVVALGRMEYKGVAKFLDDESEFVVTNAARAINDDAFIKEALDDLARLLEQDEFMNEPLLRRAINANLYVSTPQAAKRLATFATKENVPEEMRAEALLTLSVWPHSSTLDRVTGRYRGATTNDTSEATQAIAGVIEGLLNDGSMDVRKTAIKAVGRLAYEPSYETLFAILQDDDAAEVRIAALSTLQKVGFDNIESAIEIGLDDNEQVVRMTALKMTPESGIAEEAVVDLLASVLGDASVVEQQSALLALGHVKNEAAHKVLAKQLEKLTNDELMPEIRLDLINAIEQSNSQNLHKKLKQFQDSKPKDDPIATYRATLQGGNAEAGKEVFYGHDAAQCTRCHAVGGQGAKVGPDLSNIGNELTREQLLTSLIDPSSRISPGFGVITVTLTDGTEVQGTVEGETENQLTLETTRGEIQTINKAEIEKRQVPPSAMFPMGEILTKNEIRDIIEFLTTLKD